MCSSYANWRRPKFWYYEVSLVSPLAPPSVDSIRQDLDTRRVSYLERGYRFFPSSISTGSARGDHPIGTDLLFFSLSKLRYVLVEIHVDWHLMI